MLVVLLSACVGPLEPGFEADLVRGYVCEDMYAPPGAVDPLYYTVGTDDERVRLQAYLAVGEGTFPSETASLYVFLGHELLYDDPCNDKVSELRRPDAKYVATSGSGTAVDGPSGGIGLVLDDVVLEPRPLFGDPAPDWPPVTIDHAELPEMLVY